MNKKSREKLKDLENEESFDVNWKAFFINFKGISAAKNCLRPESAPVKHVSCAAQKNEIFH